MKVVTIIVVLSMVLVVLVMVVMTYLEGRSKTSALTPRQQRELLSLLWEADQIMSGIGRVDVRSLDDPEVIRDSTRQAINRWLDTNRKRMDRTTK